MKTTFPFLAALLLAPLYASTPARTEDRFPSFSWERVQCYMHIRKDTAFTADEIRHLASFPLVTFEKGTGAKDAGSTEAGTLAAARAVKAINPATKVLYYRNVFVHYGGYAANASLTNVPGAFLVSSDGNDKLVRGRVQAYDLTNAKVRDWWVACAKQVCADPSIDGLFLDGNVKVLEPAYMKETIGEAKKAGVLDGYTNMMEETRRQLGPNTLMLANVLRARFPDSGMGRVSAFDGSYLECFEVTSGRMMLKDYVAKGIAAFQEAARKGFIVAFTAGLDEEASEAGRANEQNTDERRKFLKPDTLSDRRFQYLLALFLVCAERHSYFYAHNGYYEKNNKSWMMQRPELERSLGEPKGPAIRTGYIYTREFAHASVRLDVEKQIGSTDWNSHWKQFNGPGPDNFPPGAVNEERKRR